MCVQTDPFIEWDLVKINALCILQIATNLLTSISKMYNNRLIELKTNRFDEQWSNIYFITKWVPKLNKGAGLDIKILELFKIEETDDTQLTLTYCTGC